MPKRKNVRTPSEEEEFQRNKRAKAAERQRNYRARKKNPPQPSSVHEISGRVSTNQLHNDLQIRNHPQHYLGPMNTLCTHCNAKHFLVEKIDRKGNSFFDCCAHGQVLLPAMPDFPEILHNLFTGIHPQSAHFRQNIRYYNNSFAFASFNANLAHFPTTRGPYCFKIHGQIYYQINTALYAQDNDRPSFGQLFIIDQEQATDLRCRQISSLNQEIVKAIDNALRICNQHVHSYQMMHEELQKVKNQMNQQHEPEMQLLFSLKKSREDRHRYNFQRENEVAAIFTTTADGDIPEAYVTIRDLKSKTLQVVNSVDPNVEFWIYPLFYPHGTFGWDPTLQHIDKRKRTTRAEYIKYRMANRDSNYFLMGGRLFQQWIVDNFVKVEKDRMYFFEKTKLN